MPLVEKYIKVCDELGINTKKENEIQLKWNKQSEKDILDSFDDFEFHCFICLMCNGCMCEWTGINDEHDDGIIEKHLTPNNGVYNIEQIVYWTEITDLKYNETDLKYNKEA